MATHLSNLLTWSEVAGSGSTWNGGSLSQCKYQDGVYAYLDPAPVAGHGALVTRYIRGLELESPLPAVTDVASLTVWIRRQKSGTGTPVITDNSLRLVRAGTQRPEVDKATATAWLGSWVYEAHVFSQANLIACGFAINSNADFNVSNFGQDFSVALAADEEPFDGFVPYIDHIFLEFEITPTGGGGGAGTSRERLRVYGAKGMRFN